MNFFLSLFFFKEEIQKLKLKLKLSILFHVKLLLKEFLTVTFLRLIFLKSQKYQ
jgi:hypothetical protein